VKTIPSQLQDHLEQSATTVCLLFKIVCRDGDVFGFAQLDRDVVYDDGTGERTYRARSGFDASAVAASADLDVDNAEASGRLATWEYPEAITEAQIQGGKFDYAEAWVWLVNYEDLTPGRHAELMSGSVGKIRTENGQIWNTELISLSAQMNQDITPLTSLTCRYSFGDADCGVDTDSLWRTYTVTSVGVEDDRTFSAAGMAADSPPAADDDYSPGLVEFLSGANAGLSFEVESNAGATINLAIASKFPVQEDDEFRIRPDCRKRFREDCVGRWANGLNFGGEPDIPIADEDDLNRGDL
jgi:uncharacterized phage protein (TIGR02218 family)